MKSTALESHREGRIVNVSSLSHRHPYREGIRFEKINDESSYRMWSAYGQSKLANILHANELAKRLKVLFRLRVGLVKTIAEYMGKNLQQGTATTCYVALHPQVKGVSREFFSDCNLAKQSALAKDEELAKKLWDFSLSLTSTK
ncbi:hypothetical protein RHMOL_Rhmol02G0291400 [Rhododendron molle]|uniref:Uncharacterized protein n=1 Tax=Rhododendron molle TaxID=49168 RepID=A0ACC0PWR4_RHOML|nr:hypothetical protein RHMOL_Rhmol02G0291400 [Rhododendron molle]